MIWSLSWRADQRARAIADRHYNRQKVGAAQFVPPGRCLVLATPRALWVTSWPFPQYVKHRWPGAWINSLFRREGGRAASKMIIDAVAATRWRWPDVPELGMVTFIDPGEVRTEDEDGKPVELGRVYMKAGFEPDGETAGGLRAFRLRPERMPRPEMPHGAQLEAA